MKTTQIYKTTQLWNKKNVVESNNCYSYAVNDMDYGKYTPQPGVKAGMRVMNENEITCPNVWSRVQRDIPNAIRLNSGGTCPKGYREAALVVDPGRDYHFYRKHQNPHYINKNGKWVKTLWSHKPGVGNATLYDDSGHLITNPRYADRNYTDSKYVNSNLNYKDYCTNFCVPENNVNVCSVDQC